MKSKLLISLILPTIVCTGCTSLVLKNNAVAQSKTVSDLLADEILYNLVMYKDYYDGKRVNGIPSFVKLSSGMSTVQQTLSGTMTWKVTATTEKDPGFTGSHQATDNWAFSPVVDPVEINRFFNLYRVQFVSVPVEELPSLMVSIYPPPQPPMGSDGRPAVDYFWQTNASGEVIQTNGQLSFIAKPRPKPGYASGSLANIPGALRNVELTNYTYITNGLGAIATNQRPTIVALPYKGWFSWTAPTNVPAVRAEAMKMGPYFQRYVWITNSDNFVQFAELVLGGTNVTQLSVPLFFNQNGLIIPNPQGR